MITELKPNEIFVYGSNTAGHHGRGAAKQAEQWGAKRGIGFGLSGQTFGIPTKDHHIRVLPISEIQKYVAMFIEFAKLHPELQFLVTAIGCGLAKYEPKDIAPLFKEAKTIQNIHLPQEFLEHLY